MRKNVLVVTLLLCVLFALTATALAEGESYIEKTTAVISDGEPAGEIVLRFYDATPNVAYMGLSACSMYLNQQPLTFRDNGDGTCALVNGIGEELICDAEAGQITVADWDRFFDLPMPIENDAKGWKDTTLPCVRFVDVTFEGEAQPVTFDFTRYGINLYVDGEDIYLPVSIVNNIMTDVATRHLRYNGEDLYLGRVDLEGIAPEGFYNAEKYRAELEGQPRPDDIVRQCYADLCFTFDYLYGCPGRGVLGDAVAEKGLDQALIDLGDEGLKLREGLLSSDLPTYLSSINKLFMLYLCDGHTSFISSAEIQSVEEPAWNSLVSFKLSMNSLMDILNSPMTMNQIVNMLIPNERSEIWGEEFYRECGNTAIIRLDTFMPDEAAWDSYYSGEGDWPEDALGNVISGLRKASENPAIENVILDLSCNAGGSPDVMMTILAMTTGQDKLYGIHKLTGRRMTFTFEVDANFDGVFDERDKAVRYDYNYGVLTTRYAFSCGNLFPFIFQEGGAVVIGEPTSGGSCCVQVGTDSEGFMYMMSSAQWQLVDAQGMDVESGCSVDLPIEPAQSFARNMVAAFLGASSGAPTFEAFFDDARLNDMMNEWFSEQALSIAA